MAEVYLARDFANVDGADGLQKFTQCLQLMASLEFFQSYKQTTFDWLQLFEGATVLEVGCGMGADAIALARHVGSTGKIVAIDRSQAILNHAIVHATGLNLPLEFVSADAQSLPFADNTFDRVRVDRTLQHIADPQKAIDEIARVLRPGGYLVAMEPDWETFIVESANNLLTRKLLNFWCDSFPTLWIGRRLLKYFRRAGLINMQIRPETLIVNELKLADQIFDLVQTAHGAVAAGIVSPSSAQDWLQELQQLDQAEEFFCSFTGFIVRGEKRG